MTHEVKGEILYVTVISIPKQMKERYNYAEKNLHCYNSLYLIFQPYF